MAHLRRFRLLILLLITLAVILPFTGQAVHVDAHQFIDWAKLEVSHPLWQHLPNYEYFGVRYHDDDYHDTHPRLQSLYLSMWLRLTDGNLSEPVLHLEMVVFPLIAVTAMYFLARRFKANPFIATLLFIVSPAILVNTHLIMTDVPGIALWLAAFALYIKGVDKDRIVFLVLSSLFLTLAIFTYYQDLSIFPLAFLYILLFKKIRAKTVVPLAVPAILFLAFVSANFARYGQPPNFSYTFGLPMDLYSIIIRTRGTTVLLGGALLFPVAVFGVFSRYRSINYIAVGALAIAVIWSSMIYLTGSLTFDSLFLLPWLFAAGVMVLLFFARKFAEALPNTLVGAGGRENLILATWFLGIVFYNYVLLPYPSPRYLIPLVPPLAIFSSREIEKLWGFDRRKLVVATALIASSTLALGLAVAVGEHKRANNNRTEAEWVEEHYPLDGHVWFNGGLGYQYYLEKKGYSMALINGEGLQKGDYIIESVGNNRWYFDPNIVFRLELVDQIDFPRGWPVMTEYYNYRTSWLGQIGMVVPYGFQGEYLDRLYIYRVALDEEEEYACRIIYE